MNDSESDELSGIRAAYSSGVCETRTIGGRRESDPLSFEHFVSLPVGSILLLVDPTRLTLSSDNGENRSIRPMCSDSIPGEKKLILTSRGGAA